MNLSYRRSFLKSAGAALTGNRTANNAEIDHMIDKVAFIRESLPKAIELAADMHGR